MGQRIYNYVMPCKEVVFNYLKMCIFQRLFALYSLEIQHSSAVTVVSVAADHFEHKQEEVFLVLVALLLVVVVEILLEDSDIVVD
jgi:hypothetical protein